MDNLQEHLLHLLRLLHEILLCLFELLVILNSEKAKRWEKRQWIVRPMNQLRFEKGFFNVQFQEMKEDPDLFFRYTRMDLSTFNYLLDQVKPYLLKRPRKDVISAEERLVLTLRYLASGDEFLSLALLHRMGESTARNIVYEVCQLIYNVLSPVYLTPPVKQAWRNISKGFYQDWNIPQCVGAVDGKHITIRAPPNSGSLFYNHKKTNSIVLLAACNHRYEFTVVDIGAYGGESDGGILTRSEFGKRLNDKKLDIPEECKELPGTTEKIPYFFIGDEAFQLKTNFMRPFPGRNLEYKKKKIFNYRLSRARRCIENAFGILVARWRILERPISSHPSHVDIIIKAAVAMHNFLMAQTQKSVRNLYCPPEFVDQEINGHNCDGDWRGESALNECSSSRNTTKEAYDIRNKLANYFVSPAGEVPWQHEYVTRGCNSDC